MKLGFIGTGSMGSLLIKALLQSNTVQPDEMIISNRTRGKALELAELYPGMQVADHNVEAAAHSDILFLCMKPLEHKNVIDEIRNWLRPEQIVITITSPVRIEQLEQHLPSKIAKVIPSITNYVCSGAALCMFGSRIQEDDRRLIMQLLEPISTPLEVEEQFTRITSDISSCGPAFLSFFMECFITAAVQETGLPREEAERLAAEMVLGTGKLLTNGQFTPRLLRERVSVPGGITAEAIGLMAEEWDGMFERMVRITHMKYAEDQRKLNEQFNA